jgi:hypothetical protein
MSRLAGVDVQTLDPFIGPPVNARSTEFQVTINRWFQICHAR